MGEGAVILFRVLVLLCVTEGGTDSFFGVWSMISALCAISQNPSLSWTHFFFNFPLHTERNIQSFNKYAESSKANLHVYHAPRCVPNILHIGSVATLLRDGEQALSSSLYRPDQLMYWSESTVWTFFLYSVVTVQIVIQAQFPLLFVLQKSVPRILFCRFIGHSPFLF